jgi:hypothetical protein
VQFALNDALTNIFCPATKLWNTGRGATLMREAVEDRSGGQENSTNLAKSNQINIYFTRAQADELIQLFDQGYLMSLISGASARKDNLLLFDNYRELEEEEPKEAVTDTYE